MASLPSSPSIDPLAASTGRSSSSSDQCRAIYIAGDISGIGKSSISLALLSSLMRFGYSSNQLAYIKPCTQCTKVSLVAKWCHRNGISQRYLGPIVFYAGYTYEAIDGKLPSLSDRQLSIKNAVKEISVGKKIVLVDGVGFPSVGSCAGVSNASVCKLLGIPTIIVGKAGVGDAIDSMVMCIDYFNHHGVTVLGALFNKIPPQISYHSYDNCVNYVTKFFNDNQSQLSIYAFIPKFERKNINNNACSASSNALSCAAAALSVDVSNVSEESSSISNESEKKAAAAGLSCLIRKRIPAESELSMNDEEVEEADHVIDAITKYLDVKKLLNDVENYYAKHSQ